MAAMSASLSLLDSMIASLESSLGVAPVKQGKPNPGKPAKPAAAAAAAAGKPAPAAAAPAGKPDSAPAGEHPSAKQSIRGAQRCDTSAFLRHVICWHPLIAPCGSTSGICGAVQTPAYLVLVEKRYLASGTESRRGGARRGTVRAISTPQSRNSPESGSHLATTSA